MPSYTVSFRIHQDSTYQIRYEDFVTTIRGISRTWWAETTSFFAIMSDLGIGDVASKLFLSKFAPEKDLFLVLDCDQKLGRICGKFTDQDIFKIIPYVKVYP